MKNLETFLENLKLNLGENLAAVIAFGSQANVDNAKNNINLMIVTNELNAENLYAVSKSVKKWVKSGNPLPVIMNKDEWFASFDVYAIEYAEIKDNYRIIYGEDLVKTININKYNLRMECESEIKNLLLKYKNNFLMNIQSDSEMKKVLNNVIKTALVVFRSILRLHDKPVPYRAVDTIEEVSRYITFTKPVFTKIAKVRYEKDSYTKEELRYIESQLLLEIQSILMQIDLMRF